MVKTKKTKPDADVKAIRDVLATYKAEHPRARIEVRRRYAVCIQVRIIDPDFKNMRLIDRDSMLWRVMDSLPDEIVCQITMLLLLTPNEAKSPLAGMESDAPVRSRRR
jgi:hypothetical protein